MAYSAEFERGQARLRPLCAHAGHPLAAVNVLKADVTLRQSDLESSTESSDARRGLPPRM